MEEDLFWAAAFAIIASYAQMLLDQKKLGNSGVLRQWNQSNLSPL